MENRPINSSNPPDMYGQPQVFFRPKDFDAAIWSHGYDITCEQAIRCPCQGASGAPMPDCQNCHGSGYFYVNPIQTRALITGLNRITQYVQWAPELMGTAAITVRDTDKELISYLNRIVVNDEYAWFTELKVAHTMVDDIVAVFLSYAPIDIEAVFLYMGADVPLRHCWKKVSHCIRIWCCWPSALPRIRIWQKMPDSGLVFVAASLSTSGWKPPCRTSMLWAMP